MMGTFFTVPQDRPAERTRIFKRAERILRRTGESVYLSPEGARITTGEIGHFNKGAFHLATNLRVPIVPFFIAIPPDVDPGRGIAARPGVIDVTGWGGKTKTYELEVNLNMLMAYGLTLSQMLTSLNNSNINVGGNTVNIGAQVAVVRGVGLIRSRVDGGALFNDLSTNDFGLNVGAGVNGFFNNNIGIRGDIRYFRSLTDNEPDDEFDLALSNFDFWRATVGLTFRFGNP